MDHFFLLSLSLFLFIHIRRLFNWKINKISNATQTIPCCCFLSGLNFNLKRIVWNDIWCFFFYLSCCALLPPEGATWYWFELEMENIERSFKIDFHNYLNVSSNDAAFYATFWFSREGMYMKSIKVCYCALCTSQIVLRWKYKHKNAFKVKTSFIKIILTTAFIEWSLSSASVLINKNYCVSLSVLTNPYKKLNLIHYFV